MDAHGRPALRPVEAIVVPDPEHGRVLVLRDTQGLTDSQAVLPPVLERIVSRFDGRRTCAQIAAAASRELGAPLPVEVVVRLASELEQALLLEGPRVAEARRRLEVEFAATSVRAAAHAGGAYHGDPAMLRRYLDEACLGAPGVAPGDAGQGALVGLVAPHIDPWRGARGYGHAYRALGRRLPADVDTFVLLGTSHAPMRAPFALCRKAFATPLGTLEADVEAIDALSAAARGFDPYGDQLNHKREHSLEFQAVFLRHLLGERPARIVPILAGLGAWQMSGEDPAGDRSIAAFVGALRGLVEARPGRVVVVAGADLAHVGPRFGDPQPYDPAERRALEGADRTSLERAMALDAAGFWSDVAADLEQRRVCGLAPIWALLQCMAGGATGRLLHYEQNVDPADGSIVSHAAVGFYA